LRWLYSLLFFFQAEDGIRDRDVTGVQTCALPICMGDSFRENTEWQFLVGGQFVAHPGNDGTPYTVHLTDREHVITRDIEDFEVASEQYYLHVDPGIHVLADCGFPNPAADGPHSANVCRMPTIWTKSFGKGKIFYNALGHQRNVLEIPVVREIMRRGFLWASR